MLLQNQFNNQHTIFLPKARYDWIHLRGQDYATIVEYNTETYKITSQLSLCGEPIDDTHMIDKTLSTFHVANIILAQQYRNMRFTKYSNVMSMLLLVEKHNELLLKNHGKRPTGMLPIQSHKFHRMIVFRNLHPYHWFCEILV